MGLWSQWKLGCYDVYHGHLVATVVTMRTTTWRVIPRGKPKRTCSTKTQLQTVVATIICLLS